MAGMVRRDDADDGETACHFSLTVGSGDMSRVTICQDVEGIASCGGAATMSECAASGRWESHVRGWLVMKSLIQVLGWKWRM